METFGQRLKILRQSLSQQAVADRLGIPQTTWNNYETDKSYPKIPLLDKICTVFGVKIEWLLFGRGPVYDEEKVQLVHARVGGGPNALRCGQPSSTIELKPEYKQTLDHSVALESRAMDFERLWQMVERERGLMKEIGELKAENARQQERIAALEARLEEKQVALEEKQVMIDSFLELHKGGAEAKL